MAEQDLTEHERSLILKFAANPLDFFSGETRGWLEDFIHLSGPAGGGTSGTGSTGLGPAYYVPGDSKTVMVDLTAQTGEYIYEDDSGKWLYCNGAQVSQTTYADLYAFFGPNRWGTDTGGNFFLPDPLSRALYFCGTHADADLGDSDGITLASRRPKHQHSVSVTGTTSSDSAGTPAGSVSGTVGAHTHSINGSTGIQGVNPNSLTGGTGFSGGDRSDESVSSTGSATPSWSGSFTGSALAGHAHTTSGSGTAGSGMALDAPPYLHIGSLVVRY